VLTVAEVVKDQKGHVVEIQANFKPIAEAEKPKVRLGLPDSPWRPGEAETEGLHRRGDGFAGLCPLGLIHIPGKGARARRDSSLFHHVRLLGGGGGGGGVGIFWRLGLVGWVPTWDPLLALPCPRFKSSNPEDAGDFLSDIVAVCFRWYCRECMEAWWDRS
jgi:hypothetical protein